MAKVTLDVNLFRCERPMPHNALDLADDFQLARKFVLTATKIFWLKQGSASFSGFTHEGEDFAIHLRHQGELKRIVTFPKLGYGGILHVDIQTDSVDQAIGCDILGDLYRIGQVQEVIVLGPHDIPKPKDTVIGRRGKAKNQREQIVRRLIQYLEAGAPA